MFRTVPVSIIRNFSLYIQQWYMSYRFADNLRARSEWNIPILLASCQQTCMTYTIAVCTAKNPWWWTEELSETPRVLFQNKNFEKLVHLFGSVIRNVVSSVKDCEPARSAKWRPVFAKYITHLIGGIYWTCLLLTWVQMQACQTQNWLLAKSEIQLNILGHNV